ncbi:MAG: heavy metal translocating P-type ATPase [Micropruina sp.]|uniref:heavy metal translocating P-type ATPase n=1 Tax=Micropruina sp. TaxID=2737536 RepID=UPI0039E2910F
MTNSIEHAGHGGHAVTHEALHYHAGHAGHTEDGGQTSQTEHAGHGGHAGHAEQFRRLFWVMLVIAVPVVALSPMFAMLIGYPVPSGPLAWVAPVLGTVMYGWGGRPFLTGAVDEIRARQPGMMLLVGLAITVAFVASWGATLGLLDHSLEFWWELALLIVIMLLGHWVEMRSLARTGSALESLAALLPDQAELVRGDELVTVSPAELAVGDVVLVRPGGSIPADGRIVAGEAELDESMVTGESRTVRRTVGDRVAAGTVSTDSAIRVGVTATGDDTTLAGIRRLVAQAQASSSRAQRLADRAAGWLFWFALGTAALTAIVWAVLGHPEDAVLRAITVLVIACPHALGLAIPLVVAIATERAARAGVLITDRLALESMREVSTVVFDKTGTLTRGEPALIGVTVAPDAGLTADQLLALAASAESDSEHPLARAIIRAADERGLPVPQSSGFRSVPALGVSATVGASTVQVGGPRLLTETGAAAVAGADTEDAIVLHVLRDGAAVGRLVLADAIRPESREAVRRLHDRGVSVVMLTGDARAVAEQVGRDLGIDTVIAEVRPQDKASTIVRLQHRGEKVAMVGDGVNDAPALAQADVGLAIGAGTDVAIGSAGVVLAGDDPRSVISVIDLSRASYRTMRQNLWWAAGYNLVTVPLAAGLLAPIGVSLPMAIGALLMSASTIVVAANAQLLRRLDLRPEAG